MIKRVVDSFRGGLERIRWFATVFAERLRIEVAVIKLLYRSDEVDKKRTELLLGIGERVYMLRGRPERNILKDRAILDAVEEIEKLDKEIDDLKNKAAEIGSVRT
jgi:hypothetical protein